MAGGGVDIGTLKGKIVLEDDYSAAVDKAARKTEEAVASMNKAGPAIKGLAAGLGLAAGAAIQLSVDFNKSMANVATIIPNNIKRIEELKNAVQDMAVATGKSTDDLAEGLYQVVSTFGDTADTVDMLAISAKAATAGLSTTEEAINLIAAVTKGYGDTTKEAAQKAADLAFQTTNLGITNFPQLASSIGRVIPLAATLGVKQEELFAGFTALSGITGSTSEVSTQLASVMTAMVKPTEEMNEAVGKLGYSSAGAIIQQEGLVGAMRKLVGTTDGSQEAIAKLFGRVEALTATLALTSTQAESFDRALVEMGKVSGATEQALAQQTQGVNKAGFAYTQFRQTIITSMQDVGDVILNNLPKPLAIAAQGLVETGSKLLEYSGQISQTVVAIKLMRDAQIAANAAVVAGGAAATTASAGWGGYLAVLGKVGIIAGTLTGVYAGLNSENEAIRKGVAAGLGPLGMAYEYFTRHETAVKKATETGDLFDKMQRQMNDSLSKWVVNADKGKKPVADLTAQLSAARAEIEKLTPAQRANLEAGLAMGKSLEDVRTEFARIPGGVQLSEAAMNLFQKKVNETRSSVKDAAADIKKLAESMLGLGNVKDANDALNVLQRIGDIKLMDPAQMGQLVTTLEGAIDTVKRLGLEGAGATQAQYDAWVKLVAQAKPVVQAYEDQAQAARETVEAVREEAKSLDERIQRSYELRDSIEDLTVELNRAKREIADRAAWRGLSSDWQKLLEQARDWDQKLEDMTRAAERGEPELRDIRMEIIAVKRENFDQQLGDMAMKTTEFARAMAIAYIATGNLGLGMAEIGKVIKDVVGTDLPDGRKRTIEWTDSLGGLSSALADLAESSGQTMDGWAKQMSEIIGLMNVAAQSVKILETAFAKRDSTGKIIEGEFDFGSLGGKNGLAAGIAGYAQLAQAALGAASAMNTATNVAGRGNRVARGAMTGLAIGTNPLLLALTGGNSAWIGPVVGAIVGALRNPGFEQEMKRIGNEWGLWIGEELAKKIDKLAKQVGDRATAEILSFTDLANAAGGFNPRNIDMFSDKLRDLYSFIERGQITVEDAAVIIDQNFAKMAETATAKGKLINDSLRDVMMLDAAMGTNSEEVAKYVNDRMVAGLGKIGEFLSVAVNAQEQVKNIVKSREEAASKLAELDKQAKELQNKEGGPGSEDKKRLEDIAKQRAELQKSFDDLDAKAGKLTNLVAATTISSQASASAMASAISGAVALATQQGMSLFEALNAAAPAIENLKAQLTATGFDGGAAFADLEAKLALMNDEVAGPAVESMMALGDGIRELYNGGLLTTDMFAGMANQIAFTRDKLIEQGKTGSEINALLAPQLQNIWEIQQKWGTELDATTQKMLDEAEAAGLVGDKFKSSGERTVDALGKVVNRLDLLLEAMGVKIPEAINNAAGAVEDGAERMGRAAGKAAGKITDDFRNCWDTTGLEIAKVEDATFDFFEEMARRSGMTVEEVKNKFKDFPSDFPIDIKWKVPDLDIPEPTPLTIPVNWELPEGWQSATTPGGATVSTPSFRDGTNGYQNFGDGTLALLHGNEKVTPFGQEEGGPTTFILEMDGQPWLRYVSERQGGYVRVRAGSTVHIP